MGKTVVECNNVSIRYKTGDIKHMGLKDYLIKRVTGKYVVKEFWADKNISFSLQEGDMLGIVGTNGAGKSTLLKAITGILDPVKGNVKTRGNIAALLELSSGFDLDLTVKENAYLRGAMLGYTRQFMDDKYDQIIEFAELEQFQDYTFSALSSGMRSRLAFSIACLVNPDILILDEVLSVGDGAFRKKSGDKMRQILSEGITGILVSHSITQVRELCNKILWIDHGNQIAFGDNAEFLCNCYEEFLATGKLPQNSDDLNELNAAFEKRHAKAMREETKRETERFLQMLREGESEPAVEAALAILRENRPEALKLAYRKLD
ncbi:ABC transporter ATP-binding protein [Butyrivibrio sp. NC2002]|uniref:ABC transporter ATP-binding protein n=1 Tax=Butyrivibrio sp. NC2002 TaxID=1410610 RepID=UPI0009DF223C|nr:ABC transporter ATP-binding protein [Butyrivibrio sp. NC2002]